MRIHENGRKLEIKVDDTVLMQCTGRKRVVIEEGWKSWRKYRLMVPCTKATSMRIMYDELSINKVCYMPAPNSPHPRKYLLTDHTVVEFAPRHVQ